MFSKEFLKKKFADEYAKHYEVELFRKEGFKRYVCGGCGKGYWSLVERQNCGDSIHAPYTFIKEQPSRESYVGFWRKYEDFWKKRGHAIVPRYPVLSRWRDDLYFTIASIVDFQRLEHGRTVFEYPANPLVVPQMCLRFNDIANVGVTGRHLSCFMMAGQHSFDCARPEKGGYWKDLCIQHNFDFLTQVMAIPKEEITYGEDVWSIPDFSSFGPCIESFSRGSELVNSVFTEFRRGENDLIQPLDMQVIDVGWGFERLLWYYNGSPSAYDAVFPKEIDFMKKRASFEPPEELTRKYSRLASGLDVESTVNMRQEKEKIARTLEISLETLEKTIAPMQAIYAIADHSRALLFALTDGALPSNAAGGYNLRVLLRRSLGFIDEYSFDFELIDLMRLQAGELAGLFPELSENLEGIGDILKHEKRKFADSLVKGRRVASQTIASGKPVTTKEMQVLYESHGVTPELLEKAAKAEGKMVEIPNEFYRLLTDKHASRVKEAKPYAKAFEGVAATKRVYYEKPLATELQARVLAVRGNRIALESTLFYPEGGGQATDKGHIAGREVVFVDAVDDVIIHELSDAHGIEEGTIVKLVVDKDRRLALMRHHSATHLVIQSAQRVLGKHVWQFGSRKEADEAHVDITHYKKITREEREAIEALANQKVLEAVSINSKWMDRGEAERKYGFRLYQGGGAIGHTLRIIEVEGFDTQACGGLHVGNTSLIGAIKIIGVEGIQDGMVRLRYVAGGEAVKWMQKQHAILEEASAVFGVPPSELVSAEQKLLDDWKQRGKELEKEREELSRREGVTYAEEAKKKPEIVSGAKPFESFGLSYPSALLEKTALIAAKNNPSTSFVLSNTEGNLVVASGTMSPFDASTLIKDYGVGGGTSHFARGKRPITRMDV